MHIPTSIIKKLEEGPTLNVNDLPSTQYILRVYGHGAKTEIVVLLADNEYAARFEAEQLVRDTFAIPAYNGVTAKIADRKRVTPTPYIAEPVILGHTKPKVTIPVTEEEPKPEVKDEVISPDTNGWGKANLGVVDWDKVGNSGDFGTGKGGAKKRGLKARKNPKKAG